jgi:hypothetical protein
MFAHQQDPPTPATVEVTERQAPADDHQRQPIFVICSPRARVGCTLISRLLVEYLVSDRRRPLAFDVTPGDRTLARHLPLQAVPASLADTRGEMALFDRLILNDGAPKVIDLAADQFDAFFAVASHVGFAGEAKLRAIDVVVLFVTIGDRKCDEAYRRLFMRRGAFTVVPVVNAANARPGEADPALPDGSLPPLRIARLPPSPAGLVDRSDFSFAEVLKRPSEQPALHDWVADTFLAFRDLELRLQMAEFADLFRLFAG